MTQQREKRLLNEWLWIYHRETPIFRNAPLGDYSGVDDYKIFMTTSPRVDCFYIEDGTVYLVEAKIMAETKGIAELELYRDLFKVTPAYKQYRDLPIRMILLSARRKTEIVEQCNKKGILFVEFRPAWVDEYFKELDLKREIKR